MLYYQNFNINFYLLFKDSQLSGEISCLFVCVFFKRSFFFYLCFLDLMFKMCLWAEYLRYLCLNNKNDNYSHKINSMLNTELTLQWQHIFFFVCFASIASTLSLTQSIIEWTKNINSTYCLFYNRKALNNFLLISITGCKYFLFSTSYYLSSEHWIKARVPTRIVLFDRPVLK